LGSYRSSIINRGAARGIFKIIPAILNLPGLEAERFYRMLEKIVAIVSLSPEMGRRNPGQPKPTGVEVPVSRQESGIISRCGSRPWHPQQVLLS
jgi:hypothetical protein